MSWQVGDLALCIKVGLWRGTKTGVIISGPAAGAIYKVVAFDIYPEGLILEFDEFVGVRIPRRRFLASRFRKIKPDTEPANADDAAWLKDLLKRKVNI